MVHMLAAANTIEAVDMMVDFVHILEVARRIEVVHNKQLEIRAQVAAEDIELGRQVESDGSYQC